jgi:hypothetical protein
MNYIKRAENAQYTTEDGSSDNIMLLNNTADEPEIVNDSKTLKAYQHKTWSFYEVASIIWC